MRVLFSLPVLEPDETSRVMLWQILNAE